MNAALQLLLLVLREVAVVQQLADLPPDEALVYLQPGYEVLLLADIPELDIS